MKYRIRCASLEVDMELGEAEPLNGVISGLLGSLAGSALSRGFPPIGAHDDDDETAGARLRAKVADLHAERERRAAAQDDTEEPPKPPPSH